MRKLEVPNECPTEDYYKMLEWLENHNTQEDDVLLKENTRDVEIVDVN